jgi:hypothetical protein
MKEIVRRHEWDRHTERHLAASDATDGHQRHERVCIRCGATMITVIPLNGEPWNAWRLNDGRTWTGKGRLPCGRPPPTELREAGK